MSDIIGIVSSRLPASSVPPADRSKVVPRVCPGLSFSTTGVEWVDSRGVGHDLLREKRYSPGHAAIVMGRSTEWVLRKIRAGELYPVVRYNARTIEVYGCALEDYVARSLEGRAAA